jgi:ribosomal protein S18 acetylase RimI-like enzyme
MKEPQVAIALASDGDVEWCARVMAASEPWTTLRRDLAGCRDALARPGTELFVARDTRGDPVGFVLAAPHGFAASPYIASIAVAADARGRGIGSALLRFTEQHFAGRGHLFLLVSSFNDRAQQVYRRHGYEPIGELKDYIVAGASEIILHKRLA